MDEALLMSSNTILGAFSRWRGVLLQIETIYLGDRKLSVRTSVLEEKATACNMLCCYADELKEGFYPYVEQVSCTCSLANLTP